MSLFEELKRRNVIRVAMAYAVVAWLVLQVADVILNNVAAPPWVFWAVLLLLGIGFCIVVAFSWVFEMTPAGLRRESEIDRSQSVTQATGRKLDRLIIGVLVLALGYFVLDKFVLSARPAPDAAPELATTAAQAAPTRFDSIAVLPFADMSAAGDMEYFGDGMAEEILNVLARMPHLKVAGRTSSFSFKNKEMDLRAIGSALEVATILEGSVRRSGERIRITAQLIRTDDQSHLWSDTFDRGFDEDVFAVQEDIAHSIAAALRVELAGAEAPTVAEQRGTASLDAYNAYLRGRFQWLRRTPEGVLGSIASFQEAIALDPAYARAHAGLSDAYMIAANFGWMSTRDAQPLARAAADRALALAPGLADAHLSDAAVLVCLEWQFERSGQAFRRAIELDPSNAFGHYWYGLLLNYTNREAEAGEQIDIALRLEPLALQIRNGKANHLQWWGHLDEAIAFYRESLQIDPDFHNARRWLALALIEARRPQEALAELERLPANFADDRGAARGWALAQMGRVEEARAQLDAPGETVVVHPLYYARALAELGEMDQAFALLQEGVEDRMYSLLALALLPPDDPLRRDPRFEELMQAMGLAPYWD